jgi:DNA-binding Xre family transcriptional regulator
MAEKATKEDRRISLRTIHDETGIPMHTLKGMSTGNIRAISIEVMAELARYFGCGLDDLFILDESGNGLPALAVA